MPEIGEAKAKEPNELDHLFIEPIATELEQMREEANEVGHYHATRSDAIYRWLWVRLLFVKG